MSTAERNRIARSAAGCETRRRPARKIRSIGPSVDEKLPTETGRQPGREPHDLSEREREVVSLIAAGRSTAEIALLLSIRQSTVSTYRQRVLAKLNLRSNAEITRYAVAAGLVTRVAG